MQTDLGLRKIDKTATRQQVRERFRLYRYCKRMLALEFEEHAPQLRPKRGYANATDPRLIRPQGFDSSDPRGDGPDIDDDPKDRKRRWLVKEVEHAVNCLPEYQGAIIRKCYMEVEPGPLHPAPMDLQVWTELCGTGYNVSERIYDEQKAAAIFWLADVWGVVVWEGDE